MKQNSTIIIGNLTPALHKIIQSLLFERGFGWVNTGRRIESYGGEPMQIDLGSRNIINQGGDIDFDGQTQFGQLVAAIDNYKPSPSWKIGCRTVEVKDGALRIESDDITIPKSTLKEMLAALED